MMKRFMVTGLAFCGLVLLAGQTMAQSRPRIAPITERTERLIPEGRPGFGPFRPGFGLGEYSGTGSTRNSSIGPPWQWQDMARTEFSLGSTSLGEVTGDCGVGQSHLRLHWISFERETLGYDCVYGGAAPAGARLSLALSRGSLSGRPQRAQRAGELIWGDIVLEAQTKRFGGLPFGVGAVRGYVFTRDGVEIGALQLHVFRPVFYLPPQRSPDRDAAAVLAVSLFNMPDPANY